MSGTSDLALLGRVMGGLVVVLVLIGLAARLARRRGGMSGDTGLRVVERLGLTREANLTVVSVADRLLLLGVTAQGVSMLAELGHPALPAPVDRADRADGTDRINESVRAEPTAPITLSTLTNPTALAALGSRALRTALTRRKPSPSSPNHPTLAQSNPAQPIPVGPIPAQLPPAQFPPAQFGSTQLNSAQPDPAHLNPAEALLDRADALGTSAPNSSRDHAIVPGWQDGLAADKDDTGLADLPDADFTDLQYDGFADLAGDGLADGYAAAERAAAQEFAALQRTGDFSTAPRFIEEHEPATAPGFGIYPDPSDLTDQADLAQAEDGFTATQFVPAQYARAVDLNPPYSGEPIPDLSLIQDAGPIRPRTVRNRPSAEQLAVDRREGLQELGTAIPADIPVEDFPDLASALRAAGRTGSLRPAETTEPAATAETAAPHEPVAPRTRAQARAQKAADEAARATQAQARIQARIQNAAPTQFPADALTHAGPTPAPFPADALAQARIAPAQYPADALAQVQSAQIQGGFDRGVSRLDQVYGRHDGSAPIAAGFEDAGLLRFEDGLTDGDEPARVTPWPSQQQASGSVLSPKTWRQGIDALRELTVRRG